MSALRIRRLGVVGGGAWGTALASVAARSGLDVVLWAREPDVAEAINKHHENTVFLPGVTLDPAIRATSDLADMGPMDALLLVTPAQALRTVSEALKPHLADGLAVAICSKGIEQASGKLMSEVLEEVAPQVDIFVLSGPSFAVDVANGLPTAVTLAGSRHEQVAAFADAIGSETFRPYLSDDLVGAQIGGAVKNVLAIACGIVEGKQLGASARAALTTRGFAELVRLGVALGAKSETLSGLSGLGDLILTCNSIQSRNMSLGMMLGQGRTLEDILGSRNSVSEGVHTAKIVTRIAAAHSVEMPICEAVRGITENGHDVDEVITALMSRPITDEV